MAAYPDLTKTQLAEFTGRAESGYKPFSTQALKQARLLFKLATCLVELPEEGTDEYDLAVYAILEMADALYLSQPYQKVKANPFSSETIGSYSYSKAQQQIKSGMPTGLVWFDLAVQNLGVCESGGSVGSGSIDVFSKDELLLHNEETGETLMVPRHNTVDVAYGVDPSQRQF